MNLLRILLCVLLILSFSNSIKADTLTEKIEKKVTLLKYPIFQEIIKSSVNLFSVSHVGISIASGVVIAEDKNYTYIITARHCVTEIEELYIENKKVYMIITPVNEDLAYLAIKGKIEKKQPVIVANYSPKLGDILYHVGFPSMQLFMSKGIMYKYTEDWTWGALDVKKGCSGGGVFNEKGELIGIVWGGLKFGNRNLAILESLQDVKTFLDKIDKLLK